MLGRGDEQMQIEGETVTGRQGKEGKGVEESERERGRGRKRESEGEQGEEEEGKRVIPSFHSRVAKLT